MLPEEVAAAEVQRLAVAETTDAASEDLALALAPLLVARPTPAQLDDIIVVLDAIGSLYGAQNAALAVDYFAEARGMAGAVTDFRPTPAPEPTDARWRALAKWGVDPLNLEEPDPASALSRYDDGMRRTVAGQHRLTVVQNATADPSARGWSRVTRPDACGFCRMLADRGGVYTRETVTFRAHDGICRCVAAPTWDPEAHVVSEEPYRQSLRNRSQAQKKADNARAYAYIADQYGET